MSQPVVYDLYCGLGGWAEGFLAEGYRVVGFDIERHDYGTGGYPGELVLQDIRTLHGAQLRDAAVIVASSPCQEFSYRAMPWKRAKALGPPVLGIDLFYQSIRIQHEAQEAAGRQIPLIMENVRGAEKWIGPASWKFKSFYLWGDVPALMPKPSGGFKGFKGFKANWRDCEASRAWSSHSKERKEWSAQIAKIPEPLARHIAKVFKPVHCDLSAEVCS
jgi:site-specific DNA-cytosine methylase